MPHDHGRAQRDAGHFRPQAGDQRARPRAVHVAVHPLQHPVRNVLQGDVQVAADLGVVRHRDEHVLREIGRIGIMDADPHDPGDRRQALEQLAQRAALVQVQPVVGRVLRDQDQLLHAGRGERGRLRDQVLHRHGAVRAADEGNGAIGAAAVAALGNLQIGIALRAGNAARGQRPGLHAQVPQHRRKVARAVPRVHLGDLRAQLVGIALRQAAEHDQLPRLAPLLRLHGRQDGVHRLLLGVADEAAGVQHQHVARLLAFDNGKSIRRQLGQQMLGIDGVLRTAEGDDFKPPGLHPLP